MDFDIISSGSHGNCLIIDGVIAVDMGVSFKAIEKYKNSLQLVLLTHVHSDHMNMSTIRKLQATRPTLRFACMDYVGLTGKTVDVLPVNTIVDYGLCTVKAFALVHNVQNVGWKIHCNTKKIVYATDTNEIKHVQAKNYDYYFIECNHDEQEIQELIKQKDAMGLYSYERESMYNHLSKQKCDKWLVENMGENSEFTYMHKSKNMGVLYE